MDREVIPEVVVDPEGVHHQITSFAMHATTYVFSANTACLRRVNIMREVVGDTVRVPEVIMGDVTCHACFMSILRGDC